MGINDLTGEPVADSDPLDFALTPTSPCLNAGFPGDGSVDLPTTDALGNPRDATPDIGAIES